MRRQGSRNKGVPGHKVPELAKADRFWLETKRVRVYIIVYFLKEIKEYSIEMNVIPSLSHGAENAAMY